MVVERYSHVMHLVSNVRGELADGLDCFDAFRATFPAGTLSGAPKIRAMEIIEELEPVRRGVYGGAVGYFGFSGNMDTAIAIRTMVIDGGTIYAAGGRRHRRRLGPRARARGMRQQGARAVPGGEAGGVDVAMLLMIDNYDSFTYNLVQYLGELGEEVRVLSQRRDHRRRDRRAAARRASSSRPGPAARTRPGISVDVIQQLAGTVPILGVCLGHQCIGPAFGGEVVRADRIMHGKTSPIRHDGRTSSAACRTRSTRPATTRCHRARDASPTCLEISAWTAEGEIMGVRHREHLLEGVQFHPESILTLEGKRLLKNFLEVSTK